MKQPVNDPRMVQFKVEEDMYIKIRQYKRKVQEILYHECKFTLPIIDVEVECMYLQGCELSLNIGIEFKHDEKYKFYTNMEPYETEVVLMSCMGTVKWEEIHKHLNGMFNRAIKLKGADALEAKVDRFIKDLKVKNISETNRFTLREMIRRQGE